MMINAKTGGLAVVLYLPFLGWVATVDMDRIRTAPLWLVLGYRAVAITVASLYRQRLVRKMNLAQREAEAKKAQESAGASKITSAEDRW